MKATREGCEHSIAHPSRAGHQPVGTEPMK